MSEVPDRSELVEAIFADSPAHKRTSGDAAQLAVDSLQGLTAALATGEAIGTEGGPSRHDVDERVHQASIALGRACLDGMRGMVYAEEVDGSVVMPRPGDGAFAPLDDAWQTHGEPYRDAAALAAEQEATLERLRDQPNQLFRRLAEAVALSADLAFWTVWVLLPPKP